MATKKTSNKRKSINWNKKSDSDSARIKQRAKSKEEINKLNTSIDDSLGKPIRRATGKPLRRLREKIKEIYDSEEDDENGTPLFNINLLGEDNSAENSSKKAIETIRIVKEQQLAGKLSVIMSSTMAAKKAGLSDATTKEDKRLLNSAEYDVKKLRKRTLKQKIQAPLKLAGDLSEIDLLEQLQGIEKATEFLSADLLEGIPAKETAELSKESNPEDMAKLILKKSGRAKPKKKLSAIAYPEEQSTPSTQKKKIK